MAKPRTGIVRTQERPKLHPEMTFAKFQAFYYPKQELLVFARQMGLRVSGSKPELSDRIARRLQGLPEQPRPARRRAKARDSDRRLTRDSSVEDYFSDAATRAFFQSEIGPNFHFTYQLNQFRLARTGLNYGDLVDEWLAERARRRDPTYQAHLAEHGKWNRFVRDFFADPVNKGRPLADAAELWNVVKAGPGDHRYQSITWVQAQET
jgi:hypothetical protein